MVCEVESARTVCERVRQECGCDCKCDCELYCMSERERMKAAFFESPRGLLGLEGVGVFKVIGFLGIMGSIRFDRRKKRIMTTFHPPLLLQHLFTSPFPPLPSSHLTSLHLQLRSVPMKVGTQVEELDAEEAVTYYYEGPGVLGEGHEYGMDCCGLA